MDGARYVNPEDLFKQSGTTFDDFWAWRQKKDSGIKAIRDRAQTQGLGGIKASRKPFVVIQAVNDRAHLWQQRAAGIQATKTWLGGNLPEQECLVINNSGGHWDSTRVTINRPDQHIESSGTNLACGCYTLMNIVIQYSAHANKDRLNEALEKLTPEEQGQIRSALNSDPKVNSSKLSAALVRKFTQAAIQVLPPIAGAAKTARDLTIQNVVTPHYQLATEELGMALDGLGIRYIEQSALGQIANAADNDEFLKQNVQLNLLGMNGEKSFKNQMQEIREHLLSIAHLNPAAAGLPTTALTDTLEAFILLNSSSVEKKFLIPADFIFYCEALGCKKTKVDDIEYFSFLKNDGHKNDGHKILIPVTNTAQSKIYSLDSANIPITELLEVPSSEYNGISELLLAALNDVLKEKEGAATSNEAPSSKPKEPHAETLKEKAAITNAISELANPKKTPDKDHAAVKAAIKAEFEAALETQKDKIAPEKAYRGIGLEANAVNLAEGVVALQIEDIFEKGKARFFADGATAAMGSGDLKTKLAGKFITEVGGTSISDLAAKHGGKDKPAFLKAVVGMFRGEGNLEFTVTDELGTTKTKIKCERNIFVAQTCPEAKDKLSGKKGAQYNPETHGIEVLAESDKITAAAKRAMSAARG